MVEDLVSWLGGASSAADTTNIDTIMKKFLRYKILEDVSGKAIDAFMPASEHSKLEDEYLRAKIARERSETGAVTDMPDEDNDRSTLGSMFKASLANKLRKTKLPPTWYGTGPFAPKRGLDIQFLKPSEITPILDRLLAKEASTNVNVIASLIRSRG